MVNKYLILSFIIFQFITFNSCKKINNESLIEIHFDINDISKNVSQKELLDTIWQIKLESDTSCLVSMATRVLTQDSFLYIYDESQSKIFIFNINNGKFISKIDDKGHGPNEYIKIEDIFINYNKQLVIYNSPKFELFYYSKEGKFIKKEKLSPEIYFRDMIELKDGTRFFYLGGKYNNYKNINDYQACFITKDNEVIKYIPLNNEGKLKTRSPDSYIVKNNEDVFFHLPLKNIIYKLENYKLIEKYKIDLGKYSIPEEVFYSSNSENILSYLKNPNYIVLYGSIQVSKNLIIVPLFNNLKIIGNIWISRITNQYKIINSKISKNYYITFPRCTKGDTIICVNDYFESFLRHEETHLSENDNLTVTFYKIKTF